MEEYRNYFVIFLLPLLTTRNRTGGKNLGYDIISYKLYDSDGCMVDSGSIYLSALSEGDKFKDNSLVIYDIVPGTSYTLKLVEYDW